MIVRNCSGGVVFYEDKVFVLRNDKGEWGFPKGAIRSGQTRREVALRRVREEAGIEARILSAAGDSMYEFYSQTRRQPVCNRIHWYVMQAESGEYAVSEEEGFTGGGYFPVEEALQMVTYTQDKNILRAACETYAEERFL